MFKDQLLDCLNKGAKEHEYFTMGASFGHFLVNKSDLKAVPFEGENGLESLLEYMTRNGWEGLYEGENLIGVRKYPATVLLQAGGQIELQVAKTASLQVIDKAYLDFIQGLFSELEARGQILLSAGQQPASTLDEIELMPMAKAEAMAKYAEGNQAAMQLLKGSAQTVVTIDYAHSDDFEKKFRVASALAPMFAALFDNAPVVDGKDSEKFVANLRMFDEAKLANTQIENIISGHSFKYVQYIKFVHEAPAIAAAEGEEIVYLGEKTNEEYYGDRELNDGEINAVLEMVQPEVRATANGIELRMVDALPYPLNMAYLALIKGIFYSVDNLNAVYDTVMNISRADLEQQRKDAVESGINAKFTEGTFRETVKDLFFMATPQLPAEEQHYTQPLDSLVFKNICPKDVTKRQLAKMQQA